MLGKVAEAAVGVRALRDRVGAEEDLERLRDPRPGRRGGREVVQDKHVSVPLEVMRLKHLCCVGVG